MLSDGAAWIRNVCEEIFPGRKVNCVLDQFHALEYAAAVQALAPDKGERQARMERIKQQLNAGQVACVLDGPEPHAVNGRDAAGRKREPTPCSPPNAASKATARPTSSIGGFAAPQPSDQRK